MIKYESGRISLHLLLTIFLALGTVTFVGLAVIASHQLAIAITTVGQQIDSAAAKAKTAQKNSDDAANAKANQLPYRTYTAGLRDGGFQLQIPKNWSLYAEHYQQGQTQLL